MVKRSGNIVTYTSAELEEMRARGEDRTDWARAATIPLPDGSDPDDAMDDLWEVAELTMPRPKAHASLRLDADMLDWFKSQGRGYQTRINAVLRSYFLHQSR